MFIIQLLIFQAVSFVGLVVVLRRLMGRHATTATAHLQGLTQEYLRKHEEVKKRLEEAEKQYQQLLAKSQEEAHQLKDQALKEAESRRQVILEEAHQEAERIVQQAMQTREARLKELENSMEARALERACELIQEILPQELRQSIQAHWLDELIQHGLTNGVALKTREKVQEAEVVSALPLIAAQREKLLQKIETILGHPVTLRESVDPSIIAGLTVTVGHLVLDGSLVSKLRKRVHHVQGTDE